MGPANDAMIAAIKAHVVADKPPAAGRSTWTCPVKPFCV